MKVPELCPDYKKIAKEDTDTYWNQNNSDPRRTPPAVNVDNRTAVSITDTPHKWQPEDLCQCQSFLLMLDLKCKWDNLTYPALSRTGTKMSSFAKRWWRDPSPAETLLQNGSSDRLRDWNVLQCFNHPRWEETAFHPYVPIAHILKGHLSNLNQGQYWSCNYTEISYEYVQWKCNSA